MSKNYVRYLVQNPLSHKRTYPVLFTPLFSKNSCDPIGPDRLILIPVVVVRGHDVSENMFLTGQGLSC